MDFHSGMPYNEYSYDDIDRVTGITYLDSDTESFVMDDLGNRAGNQTLRDDGTVNFAVDTETNRYTSVGGHNLAYDAAGNLTTDKDGYQFAYDYENRITKIEDVNDVLVAEFDYDTQGRRVWVYDAIATTTTLYYYSDAWQVLAEYDNSNNLQGYYIFGNYIDEALLMNRSSADKYYLHDHLYSPVALLNSAGSVVERYEYDAYGKATVFTNMADWDTGSPTTQDYSAYGNPYLFTGKEVDRFDSGGLTLQYSLNRYLSQYMGRWLTPDPWGYIDGINLYEYAISTPIIYVDIFGTASYQYGNYDFQPQHDKGAGQHGIQRPALKRHWDAWKKWLVFADIADVRGYDNAARHMRHYLNNSGSVLTIDYSQLINDVPYAQETRDYEINLAIDYIEGLPQTKKWSNYPISSHSSTEGETPKEESKDWYYAVNSYETWGKALVSRDCDKYKMKILLKFEDKYNWDVGKSAKILGITVSDISLGVLHRVGIAQEYIIKGEVVYTVEWERGQRIGTGAKIRKKGDDRRSK